jgi:hypothetical protein
LVSAHILPWILVVHGACFCTKLFERDPKLFVAGLHHLVQDGQVAHAEGKPLPECLEHEAGVSERTVMD